MCYIFGKQRKQGYQVIWPFHRMSNVKYHRVVFHDIFTICSQYFHNIFDTFSRYFHDILMIFHNIFTIFLQYFTIFSQYFTIFPRYFHDIEFRMSSIKCRVSNVKYRMSSIECRVSNVEYRMSSIECRVLNVEDQKVKLLSSFEGWTIRRQNNLRSWRFFLRKKPCRWKVFPFQSQGMAERLTFPCLK